jgi:hypothetical protein
VIDPALALPVKPVQLQHMVIPRLQIRKVLSYLLKKREHIHFY